VWGEGRGRKWGRRGGTQLISRAPRLASSLGTLYFLWHTRIPALQLSSFSCTCDLLLQHRFDVALIASEMQVAGPLHPAVDRV
jgi:hypothetical protein